MKCLCLTLVTIGLPLLFPALSLADTSCSDGKVLVSFVDGTNVTYLCMDAGEGMTPTIEGENAAGDGAE